MTDLSALLQQDAAPRPSRKAELKRMVRLSAELPRAGLSRLLDGTARAPRFAGLYRDREAALAAAAKRGAPGYDDEDVAQVSFETMCRRAAWDYPVIHWLDKVLREGRAGTSVIDAGGHMGTKYVAFSEVLDLNAVDWTVYDLPGIVTAARKLQLGGSLPPQIGFETDLDRLPESDILLASGLLQYLSMPFSTLVRRLPRLPHYILLNKVALRDGETAFTLERIGHARVPYQIRNRESWLREVETIGYSIADSWSIPELGHVIPTHPWAGRSESRGYILRREHPAE